MDEIDRITLATGGTPFTRAELHEQLGVCRGNLAATKQDAEGWMAHAKELRGKLAAKDKQITEQELGLVNGVKYQVTLSKTILEQDKQIKVMREALNRVFLYVDCRDIDKRGKIGEWIDEALAQLDGGEG